MIAALLLAAGAARRFGAPKLLQELHGKPTIRWSAEALTSAAQDVIVVVPAAATALRAALDGLSLRFVVNPAPERGIGTSIASGIAGVGADARAALIALADEPTISADTTSRVVDRYGSGGCSIVVPSYGGTPGHPVLFDRSLFPDLLALTGDRGARTVVERNASRVAVLEIDSPPPIDVDTPADLARVREHAQYFTSSRSKRP